MIFYKYLLYIYSHKHLDFDIQFYREFKIKEKLYEPTFIHFANKTLSNLPHWHVFLLLTDRTRLSPYSI